MSPEESQLLKALFDRTKTASATPRDREAETLIADAVRDQPAAPYYLAQAVIVQEKGLEAAAAHIRQLEERIHALESGNGAPQAAAQGGFLSSIFGTGQPQPPAPTPAPAVAPTSWRNDTAGQTAGPWGSQAGQQQPSGPWSQQPTAVGRSGGGFLQGALGTAAGVAGGMLLANSLSGIFGSHMSSLGSVQPSAAAMRRVTPPSRKPSSTIITATAPASRITTTMTTIHSRLIMMTAPTIWIPIQATTVRSPESS